MREEIVEFISKNNLSPFNNLKTTIRKSGDSIFKTTDAKNVFNRVLAMVSKNFVFSETSNIWNAFVFSDDFKTILRRQDFFRGLSFGENAFLNKLRSPRKTWSPNYDIIVVTEDENTFVELQKLNCPVRYLVGENDLSDLERYDVVQVIDCESFSSVLERLPQSVFIDDVNNVYLERYLEELSGWKDNILLLKENSESSTVLGIVNFLLPLFNFIDSKERKILTIEEAERVLEEINDAIGESISGLTLSGGTLMKMLAEGKMPADIEEILNRSLDSSGLPHEIFNFKVPLELDYSELEKYIKRQSSVEYTNLSLEIRSQAESLRKVGSKLQELEAFILFEDFCLGVSSFMKCCEHFPSLSENFHVEESCNVFLENPQPVSFQLDVFSRCSILTGANSGGKTTLMEHLLQLVSLFHLGLPVCGRVHLPMFSDIYYFAKNKGSASRGAFETLLTQMSKIKPGNHTLVMADEIEAVTEPGVAGKIISATADYFIRQNCFLVIATHLGYEIQETLPSGARIDGIEAKGLDSDFNLIVDHNPVMGRLAHSTPELIVEKMASLNPDEEYFQFLQESLKHGSEVVV